MSILVENREESLGKFKPKASENSNLTKSSIFITNISAIFEGIFRETDQIKGEIPTNFDALTRPTISLKDFITRIAKFSYCSAEILIVALIYIDRIAKNQKNFIVNSKKIHRFLSLFPLFFHRFFIVFSLIFHCFFIVFSLIFFIVFFSIEFSLIFPLFFLDFSLIFH